MGNNIPWMFGLLLFELYRRNSVPVNNNKHPIQNSENFCFFLDLKHSPPLMKEFLINPIVLIIIEIEKTSLQVFN